MSAYFMFGKYSAEATAEISSSRTKQAMELVKGCGGEVKDVYALLGQEDLVLITEFATMERAMRASIALGRLTGISFRTAPAIGIDQFDQLIGQM